MSAFSVSQEENVNSLGLPLENEEIIKRGKNVNKTLQAAHFQAIMLLLVLKSVGLWTNASS